MLLVQLLHKLARPWSAALTRRMDAARAFVWEQLQDLLFPGHGSSSVSRAELCVFVLLA
jgi:hypothetical protein